jgi:hypothetical protein
METISSHTFSLHQIQPPSICFSWRANHIGKSSNKMFTRTIIISFFAAALPVVLGQRLRHKQHHRNYAINVSKSGVGIILLHDPGLLSNPSSTLRTKRA